MQAGAPRLEKTDWQCAAIPGANKIASAPETLSMTEGRSIMPASGPKYSPWSTATTMAFLPSENNRDNLIDSPDEDMVYSSALTSGPFTRHRHLGIIPLLTSPGRRSAGTSTRSSG